uniref:Uncharacterized protein n=1 Tax=Rhizophora mucronata TaxID=61149 RepID=A0A2P2JEU5_RHIMU
MFMMVEADWGRRMWGWLWWSNHGISSCDPSKFGLFPDKQVARFTKDSRVPLARALSHVYLEGEL